MPNLSKTLTVYHGADLFPTTDYTEATVWERTELATMANAGEAEAGSLVIDDDEGVIADRINEDFLSSHNVVRVVVGSNTLWQGRIAAQDVARGDTKTHRARQWTITTEDQNAHLRGIHVFNWVRPAETDVARVQGLVAAYLSGNARISTNLNGSNYVITSSNTVALPAKTYTAMEPFEILQEIAGEADKEMFVTVDDQLAYFGHDYAGYDSSLRISDAEADLNTLTCVPIEPSTSEFGRETLTALTTYWRDPAATNTERRIRSVDETHRNILDHWEGVYHDSESVTLTEAQEKHDAMFAQARLDNISYRVTIGAPGSLPHAVVDKDGNVGTAGQPMTGDDVWRIKPGQRIAVKSKVLRGGRNANGTFVADSFQTVRVRAIRWTFPAADSYFATLDLERPKRQLPRSRGSRDGSGGRRPIPAPEQVPQPADTLTTIACWHWTDDRLDDTDTYDSFITRHASVHTFTGGSMAANHGDLGGSGEETQAVPVTAGTTLHVSMRFRWKWTPATRPIYVNFYSTLDGSGAILSQWTFESGAGRAVNVVYDLEATTTVPVGALSARIVWPVAHGGSLVDDMCISVVDPADVVENDPAAVDYGTCPHESPHFLPSDWVICQLADLQDQITAAGHNWTRIVAASDTPVEMLGGADFTCDGTADEVEINQAISEVGNDSGPPGNVLLLPGTYTIAAAIDFQPWDTTAVTDSRHVFEATAARIHAGANLTQMVKANGVSVAAGYFLNRFDIRIGSLHGQSATYTVSRAFEMKRASDNHVWIGNITFVSGDGFYVDQNGVTDTGTFNNFIEINRITDVAGVGFRVEGGDNIHGFQGNIIKTGQIWNCGTGIRLGQSANKNAHYNTIIAAPIEHNDYGIVDNAGGNTWIVNNTNSNTTYGVSVATGLTRKSTFQITSDAETIDPNVYAEHYVLEYGVFKGLVEFVEKASAPGTPSSGVMRVYGKTDGKLYLKNDAGTEYDLTTGITDHGALTGLADDDHPQYVLDSEVMVLTNAHDHIVDEQFSGDATTTTFPLANEAVPESAMAYISGTRTPVTVGGAMNDEITFGSAPASGTNNISVDYVAVVT